jgi:hypothetical protein
MTRKVKNPSSRKKPKLPGYPHYPAGEDIYSQEKEETDVDPENPAQKKAPNENPDDINEKDFADDVSGSDLDVPGSEDDKPDDLADDDEENNYYSLGGDNHHGQEEQKDS